MAVQLKGSFPELSVQLLHDLAPWIGLSFLVLAISVAMFIRLRQRWLKVAILIVSGLLTLIMVAYYADGRLSLPIFLVLMLLMLSIFLIPALLERRVRYSQRYS